MEDDSLLYTFGEDEEGEGEGEDDYSALIDKDELMRDLKKYEEICIDDENTGDMIVYNADNSDKNGRKEIASASNGHLDVAGSSEKASKDKHLRGSFPTLLSKDIKNVNENYFGAYSSYGIHREMISDKVCTLPLDFLGK